METYWVKEGMSGHRSLRVGEAWPSEGPPAFAGSFKGWVNSPYVSWAWYTADFAESGGVWTSGLQSCSAVVYLFGKGDRVTHGAIWHVNCSSYSADHSPAKALEAIGKAAKTILDLELVYAIIGYNSDGNNEQIQKNIDEYMRKAGQEVNQSQLYVYVGLNNGMFGVSREGYVGTLGRMVVDGASERRIAINTGRNNYRNLDTGAPRRGLFSGCCCYITTAVCESLNLDDDCEPLRTLRWYRDTVLASLPGGADDIAFYYRTAPAVVEAIDRRPDAAAIYRAIYDTAILPAVTAIQAGAFEQARTLYRGMVLSTIREHAPGIADRGFTAR